MRTNDRLQPFCYGTGNVQTRHRQPLVAGMFERDGRRLPLKQISFG